MACMSCGATLAHGARFCTACGTAVAPPDSEAAASPPFDAGGVRSADSVPLIGDVIRSMGCGERAALGGAGLALLSVVFGWASAGAFEVSPWNRDTEFRVGNWLGLSEPIDAVLVIVLLVAACYLVLAPYYWWRAPEVPFLGAAAGAALLLLGILKFAYIEDIPGANAGIGIYLVMIAGALILGGGVAGERAASAMRRDAQG